MSDSHEYENSNSSNDNIDKKRSISEVEEAPKGVVKYYSIFPIPFYLSSLEDAIDRKKRFEEFVQVKGSKQDVFRRERTPVVILLTYNIQIDARINAFIDHKNEQVNTSNNQEFLKDPESQQGTYLNQL